MTKKHANKLLKWEETMITRQAIYWIMSTFQTFQSNCNGFKQANSIRKP